MAALAEDTFPPSAVVGINLLTSSSSDALLSSFANDTNISNHTISPPQQQSFVESQTHQSHNLKDNNNFSYCCSSAAYSTSCTPAHQETPSSDKLKMATDNTIITQDTSARPTTASTITTGVPPRTQSSSMFPRISPPPSPRASRPRVYVTRRIPQRGVDILLRHCDVKQWDSELVVPHGELLHSVAGAQAIFCMPCDIIDAKVLAAAGDGLRVVVTLSSTTDHIDSSYCQSKGIRIIPCPHQSPHSVAELTVALVLLTIRDSMTDVEHLSIIDDEVEAEFQKCGGSKTGKTSPVQNGKNSPHASNWRPQLMRRQSEEQLAYQWTNGKPANTNCMAWKNITQKKFGVYGLNQVGISVANLLQNSGVGQVLISGSNVSPTEEENPSKSPAHVSGCSSSVNGIATNPTVNAVGVNSRGYKLVSFKELLSDADVICVCGYNEEKGAERSGAEPIFGKEAFRLMKKSAILVTSQSEESTIDYVALYEALRDSQIKAAGLNDCNQVSVPFKTPLAGLKNCIFLPQTQESVYDMRHKVSVLMAENLVKALKETEQK